MRFRTGLPGGSRNVSICAKLHFDKVWLHLISIENRLCTCGNVPAVAMILCQVSGPVQTRNQGWNDCWPKMQPGRGSGLAT